MGTILKLNVGGCAGRFFLFGFLFFCLAPLHAQDAHTNLLTNGGMEAAGAAGTPAGWEPIWTRDAGAGTSGMDTAAPQSGINSLRVVHQGADDWSVVQSKLVPVQPGDILTLGGWVKFTGTGDAQLSVVVRAADGTVLNWMAGLTSTGNAPAWTHLIRRLAVPGGGATAQFRFTGNGLGTAWLDDASLLREAAPKAAANAAAGQTLHLTNHQLEIGINATNKSPEVWPQRDLFNTLYATPPLFFFDAARWKKDKAHFVQSYQAVCPLVRKLGYDEMRSHEFLTPDHAVQRTRWVSGTEIVVNFGSEPYCLPDGRVVAPGRSVVR